MGRSARRLSAPALVELQRFARKVKPRLAQISLPPDVPKLVPSVPNQRQEDGVCSRLVRVFICVLFVAAAVGLLLQTGQGRLS